MIIRIQTNIGQWRIDNVTAESSTGQDILDEITKTRPNISFLRPLSFDRSYQQKLQMERSLKEQHLSHGSILYCKIDESSALSANKAAPNDDTLLPSNPKHLKRIIQADGSIKLIHDSSASNSGESENAFRKGMLPLRDMKKSWTIGEFMALNDQFTFKVQAQTERWVGKDGLSLDQDTANSFQSYLRTFAFQRQRVGYLYGKFVNEEVKEEDKYPQREMLFGTELPGTEIKKEIKNQKVLVEAIYEPPQESCPDSPEGFVLLDDPMEETVDTLASMLGLTKVGWIFGHPPREEGFQLSASEVIMAAELQLESAGGVEPTPFVTVKVTVGDDGNVSFEAFQVSKQCMEMVAEEALTVGENPGFCYASETFTVIQEGKESKTVENNFFLTVVPIKQHSSEMFVSQFPMANRDHDTRRQTHDEMKKQLSKSGSAGWTFVDLLSDFNLLIYLCNHLDLQDDIQKICQSVVDRDIPLNEGYKLIIASMAGLDNAY
jgi:nuclear protein localization family protein 4